MRIRLSSGYECPVRETAHYSLRVLWLFFKAPSGEHIYIDTQGASNAEKQPNGRRPEGCDENGPAAALLVGHISIQICSTPTASPARTALPTAHFDRNKMHAISETGH